MQVITRYFEDANQALAVRYEMVKRQRFSPRIVHFFDQKDGLVEALTKADVETATAKAYDTKLAQGGAVLMVMAGHKPLCVAQTTRELAAAMGASDMGGLVEEVFVPDPKVGGISVLTDHPRFLTRDRDPLDDTYHMADWPIPLISRRKPFNEMLIEPHGRMASWPFPLLSKRKPYAKSAIAPHARMANFPIPLISRRKPADRMAIPRHGRMANMILPLISRRKPFTGSLFPRHQRMANWPWPHLINGKTGENAIIPGAPRMANFPISLLSSRKPYTGSAISRHGRMANFPISLLSGRKPFTGSMFSAHARMADIFLPLVIRDGDAPKTGKGWTLSKLFGIPTLISR